MTEPGAGSAGGEDVDTGRSAGIDDVEGVRKSGNRATPDLERATPGGGQVEADETPPALGSIAFAPAETVTTTKMTMTTTKTAMTTLTTKEATNGDSPAVQVAAQAEPGKGRVSEVSTDGDRALKGLAQVADVAPRDVASVSSKKQGLTPATQCLALAPSAKQGLAPALATTKGVAPAPSAKRGLASLSSERQSLGPAERQSLGSSVDQEADLNSTNGDFFSLLLRLSNLCFEIRCYWKSL